MSQTRRNAATAIPMEQVARKFIKKSRLNRKYAKALATVRLAMVTELDENEGAVIADNVGHYERRNFGIVWTDRKNSVGVSVNQNERGDIRLGLVYSDCEQFDDGYGLGSASYLAAQVNEMSPAEAEAA